LLALLILSLSAALQAHDARPVAVAITETLPHLYRAELRVPDTVAGANRPALVWPASCAPIAGSQENAAPALMRCPGGLNGAAFRLAYPQFNPSLASFYRIDTLDGVTLSAMLAPTTAEWIVPATPAALQVALDYLWLGVEHIIGGFDHLLFVLGLLVIARTPRRILITVTGFTLAHSITLSLSALDVVQVQVPPTEATIALSIVFLAYEISRGQRDSLAYRHPVLVSFGFGLLHGLGFATALGEIGLVPSEVLLSLLFFNVGVEVGQILFIAVVLALVYALQRVGKGNGAALPGRRADLVASYVIGVPSAYWLIERIAGFVLA
jgi:hydrogenase/urease accessory protein HupE